MSSVIEQYGDSDQPTLRVEKNNPPADQKDLTKLENYVKLLESQLSHQQSTVNSLRRDIARLKDQLSTVENNLYNVSRRK